MKKHKKALISSTVALLLCFAMLLGATYAWFTDSAISENNIIQSGNLDIEMYWSETLLAADSGEWKEADGPIFTYDNWEPGYTDVKYVKVKNAGNLAFQWRMNIEAQGEVPELADVIDVYYVNPVTETVTTLTGKSTVGVLSDVISNHKTTGGVLLPAGQTSAEFASGETILAIALHMQEDAGNKYQGKSIGDGFTIRLMATQFSYEDDSFGNNYDEDAQWPDNVVVGGNSASSTVVPDASNKTSSETSLLSKDGKINASVPAGVLLENGANKLTLNVSDVENSKANITLSQTEAAMSIDVHIDGVAKENDVVMAIGIKELLPAGLNMGNYRFYHVENGATVEMTLLADGATPVHNNYKYDPATGDVVLYLKSFSEVALVADTENAWEGTIATAFAGGDGTAESPYLIANADQLAYMNKQVSNNESFASAHYKLISDVNFGGYENYWVDGVIDGTLLRERVFYPIGYLAEQEGKNAAGETWYDYGNAFSGVFDGNGNTVSGICQRTWEMDGNYDNGYWDAAMGLFGYVYDGTVKNLTIDNFESDGEFTPTGCVAAYAAGNSNFENIAIINSNPRVYNTGNGGIVGILGNSDETGDNARTVNFTNITVDNTNKITALWGTWDGVCGGIAGMYRGRSKINLTNCHVAAQMDVYNDVCGNYQYYWYRYSAMLIGGIRVEKTDANGYTVPDTSTITAVGCTVHFGDWNDYYYCELVANSLASYTHDHQMSRLTQIQSVSEIQDANGNWTKTGNFILMNGKTPTETCYHIVKGADGTLREHKHEDAGTETVGGETVLKENNQRIFLPFNQIFQGWGWGVKNIPVYNGENYAFEGVTILDRVVADSVDKFASADKAPTTYRPGYTITLGELFKAVEGLADAVKINSSTVYVAVSPATENDKGSAIYNANVADWTKGTITFAEDCSGKLKVVITDYNFCNEYVIYLNEVAADDYENTAGEDAYDKFWTDNA